MRVHDAGVRLVAVDRPGLIVPAIAGGAVCVSVMGLARGGITFVIVLGVLVALIRLLIYRRERQGIEAYWDQETRLVVPASFDRLLGWLRVTTESVECVAVKGSGWVVPSVDVANVEISERLLPVRMCHVSFTFVDGEKHEIMAGVKRGALIAALSGGASPAL